MKDEIKHYFENLKPEQIGLKGRIIVDSISELGLGESNLNYLVAANNKKFVVRINMDTNSPDKSKREFKALKIVESLHIYPKAFVLDESKKYISETFVIIEYVEGNSLDKAKKKLDIKVIRKLAQLVANLHSLKIKKKLPKERPTYNSWILTIKERINYIKKQRSKYFDNDDFDRLLDKTFSEVRLIAKNAKYKNIFLIGHGDICQQNIIVHNGELKLIDWESLGLRDPASDIGMIFEGFGIDFSKEQEEEFLKEYLKVRYDKTLRGRLKTFRPIIQFEQFVWATMHVFEIGEKEMHEHFLERKNIQEQISYAKQCFNKCIKLGVVDKKWSKIRFSNLFPKY